MAPSYRDLLPRTRCGGRRTACWRQFRYVHGCGEQTGDPGAYG
jgi:hypothetical protein